MNERVLENWLDNSGERTFEIPFCYMLIADGFTVVHMTRHNAMEMGKDIIAIAPDGTPCAFQLKSSPGKKISLSHWRSEISHQVQDLLVGKIVHPSIDSNRPHRSFLVTNRDLEEEVTRAIDDLNRGWVDRGHPEIRLETIIRGQLLTKARNLEANLWPTELRDVKTFLEMFLEDGKGPLPKGKLAQLLMSTLPLETVERPSVAHCLRAAASAALLCGLAISPFSNAGNYAAEFEAWILFISHVLAMAQRWDINVYDLAGSIRIAEDAAQEALERLCGELMVRTHYVEGNALADPPVYRIRLTYLVGLMSLYGLMLQSSPERNEEHFKFTKTFSKENVLKMQLWGEAAIPYFLSYYWFAKVHDGSVAPDMLLAALAELLCTVNHPENRHGLADPYLDAEAALLLTYDDEDNTARNFTGTSYTVESLLHLLVKRDWKQTVKGLWPGITRLGLQSFEPESSWHYYLWRTERGVTVTKHPPLTKAWSELKAEAADASGQGIPHHALQRPLWLLSFLLVCPHRLTPMAVRCIDRALRGF